MISKFMPPYPDELFYSVLARCKVHLVSTSPSNFVDMFFGNRNVAAIIDLPNNLRSLINNMPYAWPYTAEKLIYENTLYPLYAPFLKRESAKRLITLMRGSNGSGIHLLSGIMSSSIRMLGALRFCPICLKHDISTHGEAFWHRVHQVPGVLACPEHATLLKDSSVSLPLLNKHEYYHANRMVCETHPTVVKYSQRTMGHLINLARDIQWILNERIEPNGLQWFHDKYLGLLVDRGLATSSGRIDQRAIKSCLQTFYGEEFLSIVQSPIDGESSWLAKLLRKPRTATHPVRHLLLIRYLVGGPKEFFSTSGGYHPFGQPPWPCLNAAADHYLKPVIKDLRITHCRDTKRPVGHFSCACGFEFSRRGPVNADLILHENGV